MDFLLWFMAIFVVIAYFHLSSILYKIEVMQKNLAIARLAIEESKEIVNGNG